MSTLIHDVLTFKTDGSIFASNYRHILGEKKQLEMLTFGMTIDDETDPLI
jgi:hypothetical protein